MFHPRHIVASILLSLLVGCQGQRAPAEFLASTGEESPARRKSTEWWEDFMQAVRVAQKQNRPILMNFTGSDWSPPCERWQEQILATPEFADFAAEHLILLELDFPKFKEQVPDVVQQNQVLQAVFAVDGFPTLILLEPDGEEIERMSGVLPQGPREFITWLREKSGRTG